MEWIKKHYDQAALAALALALLAVSVLLILQAQGFQAKFENVRLQTTEKIGVPPPDLTQVTTAQQGVDKPAVWDPVKKGSLFVSERYYLQGGVPTKSTQGEKDSIFFPGEKIPNQWFLDNGFSPLDPAVLTQDPDQDGFENDYEHHYKTDPNNKESHPAYYTKLYLKQYIKVPFSLLFQSYNGDPSKPAEMDFQINAVGRSRSSEFLKLGEKVSGSTYRLEKFELKSRKNEKTGADEDVSELTMLNTETNEPVTLVLTKPTDSPDSYALFTYQWPQPPLDFQVKKTQIFALKNEPDLRYKLIDIKEGQAVIQLPSGEKYTVVPPVRTK
jgi:hypothetical protein